MNIKISKKEAEEKINEFFKDIKGKSPKEIKKIKRLAMNKSIKLGEKRRLFCKKCLVPYSGKEKIRVKDKTKIVTCEECGNINQWKLL